MLRLHLLGGTQDGWFDVKDLHNENKGRRTDLVDRLIKLTLSMGFYAAWWSWRWICQRLGKTLPGTCVVLYYHAVLPTERGRFAQQMDDLVRLAKPVVADLRVPLEDGVHYAAVTFDDGYQSVIANALPELMRCKIPATLFIPTGYLGHQAESTQLGHPDPGETIVTAEQLRSISSDLVAIGSHTVTHPELPYLDEKEARRELCQSRVELQAILNKDINLLSFPHGTYNQKLLELSQQTGYKRVFTSEPAFLDPQGYLVGRIIADPTDWLIEFRLKLLGAYSWLPFVFLLKRKMRFLVMKCADPFRLLRKATIAVNKKLNLA